MSLFPTRVVQAARPMMASARAMPVVPLRPMGVRLASRKPPVVVPPTHPNFDEVNDDREPEFEPIPIPLHLPGETPSKDVKLHGYPDVPFVHSRDRPYSSKWWDNQYKRNFDEPLPEEAEVASIWAPDPYTQYDAKTLFLPWLAALGVSAAFCTLVWSTVKEPRALPKSYPPELAGASPNKWPRLDSPDYQIAEE